MRARKGLVLSTHLDTSLSGIQPMLQGEATTVEIRSWQKSKHASTCQEQYTWVNGLISKEEGHHYPV